MHTEADPKHKTLLKKEDELISCFNIFNAFAVVLSSLSSSFNLGDVWLGRFSF